MWEAIKVCISAIISNLTIVDYTSSIIKFKKAIFSYFERHKPVPDPLAPRTQFLHLWKYWKIWSIPYQKLHIPLMNIYLEAKCKLFKAGSTRCCPTMCFPVWHEGYGNRDMQLLWFTNFTIWLTIWNLKKHSYLINAQIFSTSLMQLFPNLDLNWLVSMNKREKNIYI